MKAKERDAARMLRRKGCSFKEIAESVGVSKSSVSRWVRDIQLSFSDERRLKERMSESGKSFGSKNVKAAIIARSEHCRRRRRDARAIGKEMAKSHSLQDAIFASLYWAEGEKSRNTFSFTNADPQMVQFVVSFLSDRLLVSKDRIRLYLRFYADVKNENEVIRYWTEVLNIPLASVQSVAVLTPKESSKKLVYGVCNVRVNDMRVVQKTYGMLDELVGTVPGGIEKF